MFSSTPPFFRPNAGRPLEPLASTEPVHQVSSNSNKRTASSVLSQSASGCDWASKLSSLRLEKVDVGSTVGEPRWMWHFCGTLRDASRQPTDAEVQALGHALLFCSVNRTSSVFKDPLGFEPWLAAAQIAEDSMRGHSLHRRLTGARSASRATKKDLGDSQDRLITVGNIKHFQPSDESESHLVTGTVGMVHHGDRPVRTDGFQSPLEQADKASSSENRSAGGPFVLQAPQMEDETVGVRLRWRNTASSSDANSVTVEEQRTSS